jgi:hypothetical protein
MATSFTLSINQAAADRVAATHAFKVVTNTTRRVLNRAIVLTPVDTGRLRAGNQSRVTRRGTQTVGEVWNDVKYARFVHDPTKAHTIRPKTKKVLRFVTGGRVVFSAYARIPARRGRPWLLRAMREVCGPEGYDLSGV